MVLVRSVKSICTGTHRHLPFDPMESHDNSMEICKSNSIELLFIFSCLSHHAKIFIIILSVYVSDICVTFIKRTLHPE